MATRKPPISSPRNVIVWSTEPSAPFAASRSSSATSIGTAAVASGRNTPTPTPPRAARATTAQGVEIIASAPNTAALPMSQITRLRRTRSRFSRSPTRNPISTTGVNSANSSADTQPGEPVMSNIRMARAIAAIQVPSTLMAVASQKRRNSPPPGPTSARMSDLEVGELTGAASYRPPRRGSLSDFGRVAPRLRLGRRPNARYSRTVAAERRGCAPCRIRIPREWSSRFGLTMRQRAVSSVGRAPARQAGGHWFEPSTAHPPGSRTTKRDSAVWPPAPRGPAVAGGRPPTTLNRRRRGDGPRLLVVPQAVSYTLVMKVVAMLRRIGRKLQPPGNRGSLETEYRQPNMDPTHAASEGSCLSGMNSGGM